MAVINVFICLLMRNDELELNDEYEVQTLTVELFCLAFNKISPTQGINSPPQEINHPENKG